MKLNYDVTGAERKSLVAAISQELNATAKYLGMPTAAYEVGGFHIDKTGTVTGEDNRELVADLQGLHNFKAVSAEYDTPLPESEEVPAFEDLESPGARNRGLGGNAARADKAKTGCRQTTFPNPTTPTA